MQSPTRFFCIRKLVKRFFKSTAAQGFGTKIIFIYGQNIGKMNPKQPKNIFICELFANKYYFY